LQQAVKERRGERERERDVTLRSKILKSDEKNSYQKK
jgi:hypothetical protein